MNEKDPPVWFWILAAPFMAIVSVLGQALILAAAPFLLLFGVIGFVCGTRGKPDQPQRYE